MHEIGSMSAYIALMENKIGRVHLKRKHLQMTYCTVNIIELLQGKFGCFPQNRKMSCKVTIQLNTVSVFSKGKLKTSLSVRISR